MKLLECWINTDKEMYYFNNATDSEKIKAMLLYKALEIKSITTVSTMKKDEFEKLMGMRHAPSQTSS